MEQGLVLRGRRAASKLDLRNKPRALLAHAERNSGARGPHNVYLQVCVCVCVFYLSVYLSICLSLSLCVYVCMCVCVYACTYILRPN